MRLGGGRISHKNTHQIMAAYSMQLSDKASPAYTEMREMYLSQTGVASSGKERQHQMKGTVVSRLHVFTSSQHECVEIRYLEVNINIKDYLVSRHRHPISMKGESGLDPDMFLLSGVSQSSL